MDEGVIRELLERHVKKITDPSMADQVPEMSEKFLDLSQWQSELIWICHCRAADWLLSCIWGWDAFCWWSLPWLMTDSCVFMEWRSSLVFIVGRLIMKLCVLNLLSTDILKPWLLRGSETALDLTSALNCGMPFWIRRCRRLSSCFVLHVGSDCQWLPVLHLTDSGGSGRKSRQMPTRFWPQRKWMMSLRLSLSLSLSFHFFKSNFTY